MSPPPSIAVVPNVAGPTAALALAPASSEPSVQDQGAPAATRLDHSAEDPGTLITRHRNDIEQIISRVISSLFCEFIQHDNGKVGELSYKTNSLNLTDDDKQVATPITITFPGGREHKFFLRSQTQKITMFDTAAADSAAVRKHYPHLYAAFSVGDQQAYLLEHLNGVDWEQCMQSKDFRPIVNLLSQPERFNQLVNNTYAMLFDFAREGYCLRNIAPHLLKNTMFDSGKNCFRFFDIDCLYHQGGSTEFRLLRSLVDIMDDAPRHTSANERDYIDEAYLRLIFALLQKFMQDFAKSEVVIISNNQFRYTSDPQGIYEHRIFVKDKIVEACKSNDYDAFKQLIKDSHSIQLYRNYSIFAFSTNLVASNE